MIAWPYVDQSSSSVLYHHLLKLSEKLYHCSMELRRNQLFVRLGGHLIVHPISLLLPLIRISSLMLLLLMHPLLPHQLSPLLRHQSFPDFWVGLWFFSQVVVFFATAAQDLTPTCIVKVVCFFPLESPTGLFCLCPVLNPFV